MKHQWLMRLQVFVIFTLAACDEVVMVENSPPRVTELTVCKQGDRLLGLSALVMRIGPTDVAIRLNAEQALGISAAESGISTVSPGQFGDGLVGLTSSQLAKNDRVGDLRAKWSDLRDDCQWLTLLVTKLLITSEPPESETMPAFQSYCANITGTESGVTLMLPFDLCSMSSHSSVNLSLAHRRLLGRAWSQLVNQLAIDRLEKYFSLRGRWAGTHNLAGPEALGIHGRLTC